jgi:hypothetical protein
MTSLTALGIPTASIRKATAVLQNTPHTGGIAALPLTTDGELVTVTPYRVFRQKATLGTVGSTGTMAAWFRIMPDVSDVKLWIYTPSDATQSITFALADTEGGAEYVTNTLKAQTGSADAMIFVISELGGIPWMKVSYYNALLTTVTPTMFMLTQSTSMSTAADATVTSTFII